MSAVIRLYGSLAGKLPHSAVTWIYSRPRLASIVQGALNALLPDNLREVELRGGPLAGARLPIYPRHEVAFVSGLYEFWVQDVLLTTLRPGDSVWDLGAYIGYHTLLMRQVCGSGKVVALEPDPVNCARLERTLVLNDARDVRVLAKAAGARDEVVVLRRYENRPTSSTVEGTDKGSPFSEIRVPAITLDTLSSQVGPPRLVKMDVEQTEADVLRGAPHLLREVRPLWIVELHGDEGHQAVEILRNAGYRIRSLNKAESRIYREHILAEP